jgi:adenosylcobinamide-GDP ribazoletransferase
VKQLGNSLADLQVALAFLTILPVGYPEGRKPGYAYSWFPLVGLLIGLALAGVASLPLPTPAIRSFCLLLTWVVLTGGLHLDGFGDSCDGLLATTTPEKRLEILKDPRAGSWAVVGLILLLLAKWILLQDLAPLALVAPPVVGRYALVWAAYGFPYARSSGLGNYFRDGLGRLQLLSASGITLAVLGTLAGWVDGRVGLLLLLPILTVALLGRWAAQRLGGGLTGDVYGAICELTELGCLLMLALVGWP